MVIFYVVSFCLFGMPHQPKIKAQFSACVGASAGVRLSISRALVPFRIHEWLGVCCRRIVQRGTKYTNGFSLTRLLLVAAPADASYAFVAFLTCGLLRWSWAGGAAHRAETMISEEIESVQNEADEIEPGWSQSIWPLAMQLR